MKYNLIYICIILSFAAYSQGTTMENSLTEHVLDWRIKHDVKGISVSIYDGQKTFTIVDGWRNAKNDTLQLNDSFIIASVSKTFTAAAILRLVKSGIIKLNDSAAELSGLDLPKEITIAQLLYHEAGLPEYMGGALSFDVFLKEHSKGRDLWASEEIRSFSIKAARIKYPVFAYSNSHFVVLGAIIEKQCAVPLEDALDSLVFNPSKLDSARLIKTGIDNPEAFGNSEDIKGAIGTAQIDHRLTCELATAGDAAGGMAINSSDLARWAALFFSGHFVDNLIFKEPLGGEAFGLNDSQIRVGPGVYEVRYGQQTLRLHGGDGLGSTAIIMFDPILNKSVAILVNDDKVHSLGFGEPDFLDQLAISLLNWK